MAKISKETLLTVAASLTVAEAIFGIPGKAEDSGSSENPPIDAYESFKDHLKRLEEEYQ
jgi:hypothetical protein